MEDTQDMVVVHFLGKDASKVDRSAAYMLRHIAKNIVANGYAKNVKFK